MFVPIVLTTLLEHPEEKYIVYTDQDGMYQLFKKLNVPNSITLQYPQLKVIETRKRKKYIINQLCSYRIESITFYHTEYGQFANWLIGKLSKKTKIYFQPPYEPWALEPQHDLKALNLQLKTYLLYGYWSDILLVGEKRYISMASSFYKKNNVIRIEPTINSKLIAEYVNRIFHFEGSNKIVWLDGAVIAGGVEPKGYTSITDSIIMRIGKEHFFSKCHPRFNDLYGVEKELREIPSYIPINILLDSFDIFIGYWSTALVEAAKLGKIAISTINIMPQTQEGRIETEKKVLDDKLQGKGIILYPKSKEELVSIVLNGIVLTNDMSYK